MERVRLDWDKKTFRYYPTKTALVKACRQVMSSTRYQRAESIDDVVAWSQKHVYALGKANAPATTVVFNFTEEESLLVAISDKSYVPAPTSTDLITSLYNCIAKVWLKEELPSDEPDEFI